MTMISAGIRKLFSWVSVCVIGSFPQSQATDLGGVSYQSGDMVMKGYLYVPSCQLNTMTMNGSAVTANGGGYKMEFTEISGVRWAKAASNEVMQAERVNLVIENCSLSQLNINLMADNVSTTGAESGYAGLMTYLGDMAAPVVPGAPVSPWQTEENTSSQSWLYYTVGLSDARVNGEETSYLPLNKLSTGMQCNTANYCVVKLDGTSYSFSNEWKQKHVLDASQVWHGEWTPAESTLDELINTAETETGYLPSNFVSKASIILPLTVRLHHGDSTANKDNVPLGDYKSKLTITVSID